jgi:hypothetical protein
MVEVSDIGPLIFFFVCLFLVFTIPRFPPYCDVCIGIRLLSCGGLGAVRFKFLEHK